MRLKHFFREMDFFISERWSPPAGKAKQSGKDKWNKKRHGGGLSGGKGCGSNSKSSYMHGKWVLPPRAVYSRHLQFFSL